MKFALYNVTTCIKVGGIETYYWSIAKQLNALGHEAVIISGEGENIQEPNIELYRFAFRKRGKFPKLGNRFVKFAERVSFYFNTKDSIDPCDYDILVIHKPFDFFVSCLWKLKNKNLKTVFVSGGEDFYFFDRFFSRYIDFFVAVSRDNAKKISSRYGKNVTVIHNGVDESKFFKNEAARAEVQSRLGLGDEKVLMSIGRVVRLKGFQLVIEALGRLDGFHYVLAGEGEYLGALKELAIQKGVADRVHFIGRIEHSSLCDYLNAADVFVQPTVGNEAFGITLVEAMACGLPVVASQNGGMTDIVRDDENGYMFKIGDVETLGSCVLRAYENRQRLGNIGMNDMAERFTWRACATKLLTLS